MKTKKRAPAKPRKTIPGKISAAAKDFRKEMEAFGHRDIPAEDVEAGATRRQFLLAEHGALDYRDEEIWEVFRIIERQALLNRGRITSSGGPEAEATIAAKCVNAIKKHDADFFRRLAKEVRRQSSRFKETYVDAFRVHMLMVKQTNRWRVKSGLPKFTLRQVKPDKARPESEGEVLWPSRFGHLSDRHWHKMAKSLGFSFLEGKDGRPKTRNK